MIEHLHRVRSKPPRTSLDVYREQKGKKKRTPFKNDFSGSSIGIGRPTPNRPERSSPKQNPEGFDVKRHVFQKPIKEKPSRPLVTPEIERITWQIEAVEDCNNAGDLELIMQFSDISFTNTPIFERSRQNYGPDSCVFYAPIGHKNGLAFLILSTLGDIFECQIVPKAKDVNPFFREEIYCPPLLTLYDPTSMSPSYNNGLIIVSYKTIIQ